MKCTRCKGKGKFIGYYVNDNPVECECVICKGAGEVQMTEQEYIQTCNTEQLAECLARYFYGWTTNSAPYNIVLHSLREWLKQPHSEE